MPIRRIDAGDSPVFITQVTGQRRPIFADKASLDLLLSTLRTVKTLHPFTMVAYVFLPDHFHLLIRAHPPTTPVEIMHSFKPYFTRSYRASTCMGDLLPVWQQRFWDHIIRNQEDFNHHLDYIHYNPVRHGYVSVPEAWAHSSYIEWQRREFYDEGWGHNLPAELAGFSVREVEATDES